MQNARNNFILVTGWEQEYDIDQLEQLRSHFDTLKTVLYAEMWFKAVASDNDAFMMLMRDKETKAAQLEYSRHEGEYSIAWPLSPEEVIIATEYFFEYGERAPMIEWC